MENSFAPPVKNQLTTKPTNMDERDYLAMNKKKNNPNCILLENHKLERCLPTRESKAFEKLLKKANESFVLIWNKQRDFKNGNLQWWKFEVYCPTTNFANAYCHIGLLWGKMVLPIWEQRHSEICTCSFSNAKQKRGVWICTTCKKPLN